MRKPKLKHLSIAERFARHVRVSDGCWEWTGGRDRPGGYGHFTLKGQRHKAHRVAWLIAHGPVPEGLSVMHTCDNPGCVRVDHLLVGTHQENMDDRTAKGRGASKRLSDEEVEKMREMRDAGLQLKEIAARFGVTVSFASLVVRGLRRPDRVDHLTVPAAGTL